MNKKTMAIGGCALAVIAIVVALIFIFTGGEDEYRSIKVFETGGTCNVERGTDNLKAFKDMTLSSGDIFTVASDGFARLKLDSDKYVYLQADTKIRLTATGTEHDSKTRVFIERGSMTTEVQKKLSATSTYDIVTPNTTMSIRGTITHTNVTIDEDGDVRTSSAVVEGEVVYKVMKKDSDGNTIVTETSLSTGDANSVKTEKEELVDEKIIEQIAENDSKELIGEKVDEDDKVEVTVMTADEAGIEFEDPVFSTEELEFVRDLIVEDNQGAKESFDNIIETYCGKPEPTPTPTPSPTPEPTTEPVIETSNGQPVTDNDNTEANTGTTTISGDGDTNLVGLEADEEAARNPVDQDETPAQEEPTPVVTPTTTPEPTVTPEPTDEPTGTPEPTPTDEPTGTPEPAPTDEPTGTPEPAPTDAPTGTPEPTSAPTGTPEPTASPAPTSTPTPAPTVTINYGSTTAFVHVGSTSDGHDESFNLLFWEERTVPGSNSTERRGINEGELPTTFTAGDALPGTSGSDIHVEIEPSWAAQYEFAGWYLSANGARDLNQQEFVSVAPSTEGVSLYPGVKEKTFTVTYVNLFPEAGKLVLPDNQYWGNYVYNVVDTESNSRITVSGIPYNGTISLPDLEDYITRHGENKAEYLHIEGANDPEEEEGPFFAGVGVAYSGNNDSLAYSSNLNVNRILMDDEAYIQSVGSDFIIYGGNNSTYREETHIMSDMTFYLYFAIPVRITVSDPFDSAKAEFYGKMGKVDGTVSTIDDAISSYPGYDPDGSYENGQFVKLRAGINGQGVADEAYDQYWMIINNAPAGSNPGDVTWRFATYYYGKRLEIPAFMFDYEGMTYQSTYTVNRQGGIVTYVNENPSTEPISLCLSGSGSSSFPYDKYKREGQLSIKMMLFDLEETTYALLDLSETGINVGLGDAYAGVIKTSAVLSDMVSVKTTFEYFSNSWQAFWAETPEDGIYNMYTGGRKWDTTEFDNVKDSRFFISKNECRLAGYTLSSYSWDDEDLSNPLSQTKRLYNSFGGNAATEGSYYSDSDEKYITYLERSLYKYVLKPIFVPEKQPFNIELVREPGHIIRTSDNDNLMNYYNVEITFAQPFVSDGIPYVTDLDLANFCPKGYDYSTPYEQPEEKKYSFQGELRWNFDDKVYYLYNGSDKIGKNSGYTPVNGKVNIALEDLLGGRFDEMQYVQGIEIVPDDTGTTEDESITHFHTSVAGNMDCGIEATDNTEFYNYYPWGAYIEIDPYTTPFAFTAVYAKNMDSINLTAIFSEVYDTLPDNLLLALSGEESLDSVWYGGKLSDFGKYGSGCFDDDELNALFPWVVTRNSTGGRASRAIKGNPEEYPNNDSHYVDGVLFDYGCGILVFEKYGQLRIPDAQMDEVYVYPHANGDYLAIGDNSLNPSATGVQEGYMSRVKTAGEFRMNNNQQSFLLNEGSCPEGWACVNDGDNNFGYIYFGNNTSISGRLIMSEDESYFIPREPN